MKLEKNARLIRNGFGTVFVLAAFVLVASSAFLGFAHQASRSSPAPADIAQFIGTWSAVHNGTPYFVLELRKENGTLSGGVRVCAFTMSGEGDHADITITNEKPSATLPVSNLSVTGKSLTFDWKDPDGDENHLMFERTGENSGRISWRNLPEDVKMSTILLTKQAANHT